MKKIITICAAILITASVFAQAPQKMSYQAVIRDNSNALVANQTVGMQVSILQGSASGTAVYVETHNATTNINGLVSIEIGGGALVSGSFSTINWANGPFFIKTETDPTGGASYTITGTSQLLSVPYAMYAGISANGVPSGGSSGQVLTNCYGYPTWTNAGQCPPPYPAGSIFCNGTPTSIVDVINPSTGKIWMDRNLGASQVATSSTDANAYGDLYQWGRATDGHQCRNSSTSTILSNNDQPNNGNFIIVNSGNFDWRNPQNNNLWQGISGINNPCPSGYRIPTQQELEAERTSWSANNSTGAFTSPLKLPMAGSRAGNTGILTGENVSGYYWSSSVLNNAARLLFFINNNAYLDYNYRAIGFTVRCIKN